MQANYFPDWRGGKGKLRLTIVIWGESYRVCCPFCSDTKYRLHVNHRWAERDHRIGDDNLHLATCFNEECLRKRETQKQLHAMVYPNGFWAERIEVPVIPPVIKPAQSASISMPPGTLLDDLHPQHPVRRYLMCRGFNPDYLARTYGVQFSEPCSSCRPVLYEGRIVIPIYELRVSAAGAATNESKGVRLAGWQARIPVLEPSEGCPKYLTATGTQKSRLLYGLPKVVKTTGAVVLVEGITDAWKVGLSAVSMLGKSISAEQCNLIVRHLASRPIVVWLDDDAEGDAMTTRDKIRRARAVVGDLSPVTVARTPAGRHDPGECTKQEIVAVIEESLNVTV
jgi:hypothetical protein